MINKRKLYTNQLNDLNTLINSLTEDQIKEVLNFAFINETYVNNLFEICFKKDINNIVENKDYVDKYNIFKKFVFLLYYEYFSPKEIETFTENVLPTDEEIIAHLKNYLSENVVFLRDYISLYTGIRELTNEEFGLTDNEIMILNNNNITDFTCIIRKLDKNKIQLSTIENNIEDFRTLSQKINIKEDLKNVLNKIHTGTIHY